MKYNVIFKGLALLLAAVCLLACFASFMTIYLCLQMDLYDVPLETTTEQVALQRLQSLSSGLAHRYAAQSLGNCPPAVLERLGLSDDNSILSAGIGLNANAWGYALTDDTSAVLEKQSLSGSWQYSYSEKITVLYPVLCTPEEQAEDSFLIEGITYPVRYAESPEFTIVVYLEKGGLSNVNGLPYRWWSFLQQHCYVPVYVLGGGLLLFLLLAVYLCCAAGRGRQPGVTPRAINRLPLDIYLAGVALAEYCLLYVGARLSVWHDLNYFGLFSTNLADFSVIKGIVCGLCLFLASLLPVCFGFALAAQIKAGKGFWWKRSLIGRVLRLLGKLLLRVFFLLRKVFYLLPLMWQWLLIGGLILGSMVLSLLMRSGILFLLSLLFAIGMILYGGYAFGCLLRGARRMAQGALNAKINDTALTGGFRDLAQQLNTLSDVAVEAADARMRSERMKTELITNVSHDIKTPLTSIINYVDLLKNASQEADRQEYLAVLDRQSLRLKKLIDDLIELSKASSGSIPVELQELDATEALNQALGEFSDKLNQCGLQPVTRIPEEPVMIRADGRLFWRVMANLMSNTVKYAQPNTRVYVELTKKEQTVALSLKNISREPLNISAQELMERFVRGDASRNTEGSGLGLSIAGSLMDAQKGSLQLSIDGDLFKVTLTYPLA